MTVLQDTRTASTPARHSGLKRSLAALGMAPVLAAAAVLTAPAAGAAPAAPAAPAARHAQQGQAAPVDLNLPAPFNGTFTLTKFTNSAGRLMGHGVVNVTNTATGAQVRRNVSLPVSSAATASSAAATPDASSAAAPAITCSVLNLVLGPLHLNLLGLQIDLNQVVLNITAIPGGGLLGDLLCGLADRPLGGALANLLNQLLGLLGQ
jgi:hypothetical protein